MNNRSNFKNSGLAQKGDLAWVSKEVLRIDTTYQRQPSLDKARRILENFMWVAFGVLIVSVRKTDGGTVEYWILDGGHRWTAVKMDPEILQVPCLLFYNLTIEDEAKVFKQMNTIRSPLHQINKFQAGIIAKEEIPIMAAEILAKYSYRASKGAGDSRFEAVSNLMYCVSIDKEEAERAFSLCADIAVGKHITKDFYQGMFVLGRRLKEKSKPIDIYSPELKKRFKKATYELVQAKLREAKLLTGHGGGQCAARALLEVLNYRRNGSNRIEWD